MSRHFKTLCYKCKAVIAQCSCTADCSDDRVRNWALCNVCHAERIQKKEAAYEAGVKKGEAR